jgi:hypothetical protein
MSEEQMRNMIQEGENFVIEFKSCVFELEKSVFRTLLSRAFQIFLSKRFSTLVFRV